MRGSSDADDLGGRCGMCKECGCETSKDEE
jgi:hypothetical protein